MQHSSARKVITRGPVRVVGRFPSIKSGKAHEWESQLERDRMYQLELDPDVISFREQPEKICLLVDGVTRTYTPDLEVKTKSRTVIEEIKPASRMSEYKGLFEAASVYYADQGIYFSVVTDIEIRREPYMKNVTNLLRFRYFGIDDDMFDCALELFERHQNIPFGEVKAALANEEFPDWVPWALLAHGILCIDMEDAISNGSEVFPNEEFL